MSAVKTPFVLNPSIHRLRLAVLAPVLLFNGYAWGVPVPGELIINASTPVRSYDVGENGELISNGATTLGITTVTGAKLVLTDTTTTGTSGLGAVSLIGAQATISGSSITGSSLGLNLGNAAAIGIGAVANISTTTISGGATGVNAGSRSTLTLQNSTVSGTNSGSRGLVIFDATVTAVGSTITGQGTGVLMRAGPAGRPPSVLALDSTHVEGVDGAAIVIGLSAALPTVASLDIKNGSTLVGGNGNILEVVASSTANVNINNSDLTGNVLVKDASTANLNFVQSTLTGDVIAESGSIANVALNNNSLFTGRLENTSSVAINSGSQWVMVGNGSLADLSMAGGSIKLGDAPSFYTLSVQNLSGNGTFLMDVDFGGAQTDFIDITGSATGSHSLLIGSTGTDPVEDTSLHVVHAGAGDAEFSLVGGAVDLGTWSYDLVKQGANDWYLDATTRKVGPGAQTIIALFNTAPTVWYGELTTLRTRMGELRTNGGRSGGWMRTYGNKFNVADASGFGYTQQQQGMTFGADGKLPIGDGQWLAGVMAGQSKSDLDLDRGTNGKVDSYYVGAYSTWLDSETGYYFDGVLKFNRFNNKAKVNLSDGTRTQGDYSNSGAGASVEFGRHIKLDNNYFVEPYTQLAGVIIQGKDYELDNGMRAEGGRTRSLLGKVGATAGRSFDLGQGRTAQPYVRAAVAHEFAKNNEVEVNNNVFNNDLSGSRGELGTGIAVALSDKFEMHADFEYSNGDKIEQPWGANIGVRFNW